MIERVARCPYCVSGDEFRPMVALRGATTTPNRSKLEPYSLGWEGHGHSNCLPCAIAARPSDLAVRDVSPRPRRGPTRRWRRPLWWRALFRQTLRRGGHAGAHFGWLHFGFGKHSARHAGSGAPTISILRPICRHTCGTSAQRPACHPFRGFRPRFFGLRRYSKPAPTAEFLSFLLPRALVAVSSSTVFRVFLPPDASSTV